MVQAQITPKLTIMALFDLFSLLRRRPVVAVIRLNGVIGDVGGFRRGLTLHSLEGSLESAFSGRRIVAVALVVNSPGGSPVQSDMIQRRVRDLAEKKEMPVYVFCEDVAASGGYWIALAGDSIYANANSIIGSIGVISSGFGFVEAIDKLGIERRLHATGKKKGMLDPFQVEDPDHVAHLKQLHEDIFERFKDWVRERRGEFLAEDMEDLFSGAFWTGRRALELGLVDELGELRSVMRKKYGEKVRFRFFGERRGLLRRLGILGPRPVSASGWVEELIRVAEARSIWGRFGL